MMIFVGGKQIVEFASTSFLKLLLQGFYYINHFELKIKNLTLPLLHSVLSLKCGLL